MRECVSSKEKGSSSDLRIYEGPFGSDALSGSLACGDVPPRHPGRPSSWTCSQPRPTATMPSPPILRGDSPIQDLCWAGLGRSEWGRQRPPEPHIHLRDTHRELTYPEHRVSWGPSPALASWLPSPETPGAASAFEYSLPHPRDTLWRTLCI